MTRRDRFLAMLPIATEHGVITGSPPEDWQLRRPGREAYCIYPYSPCCQDPRNWRGEGPSRPLRSPPLRSCPDAELLAALGRSEATSHAGSALDGRARHAAYMASTTAMQRRQHEYARLFPRRDDRDEEEIDFAERAGMIARAEASIDAHE